MMLLIIAAVAQAVPGTPPPVPATSADGFAVGVDTLASVEAKLGKPNTVVHANAETIIVYVSHRTRVKGASFVPVVGLFAGGAKSRISTKTFTFGADGLLKSTADSETAANCSMTGCK